MFSYFENIFKKMSKTINLTIFLIGALLLPSTFSETIPTNSERRIDPELQQTIDAFVTSVFLPTAGVTGLGLAIVKDDGDLLYTTGYGLSNFEKGYQNGNKTQYGMGSITKGFTSILVIKLLHEKFPEHGAAALDIPINRLIPEANLTLIDRMRSEHTTFRDLLAHLTCLKETSIFAEPFRSKEELLYRTRYLPAEYAEPRTELIYSNIMYAVAGELTAILGGKPYEALMQDLLDDLGMVNTTFVKRTDDITEMPDRAMPYYVRDGESHLVNQELLKRIVDMPAAGGLVSSPDDMVRYLRFLINVGSIDGKQIIPEEVMLWLKKTSYGVPAITFKKTGDEDVRYQMYGYSLGFILSLNDGWEMVEHGGNLPPYSGHISFFPGKKLGIYTAGHQFPLQIPSQVIHFVIFDLLNGNQDAKVNAIKIVEKMKAEHEGKTKMAEEDWHKFYEGLVKKSRSLSTRGPNSIKVGKYGSGPAGDLELFERFNPETNQTQYFIEYGKWYHGWATPVPNEFALYKLDWVTDAIQDDYISGLEEGVNYAVIPGDDTITMTGLMGVVGVFRLGESLETLPQIPWDPRSC